VALRLARNGDTVEIEVHDLFINSQLDINQSITINGFGTKVAARRHNCRVFFVSRYAEVTISGLTIFGGFSNANGAGIYNDGNLTVNDCRFVANGASYGAGIYNGGTLTLNNSTIFDNYAVLGCGIYNDRNLTVSNSTISENSGGGIFNSAILGIGNTILRQAQNIANHGTVTSLGYNMCSDSGSGVLTGPGDRINTDPMPGPLQDNGGPTLTQALLPGSPAINTGDPSFRLLRVYDQRGPGYLRVVNGRIDIGAFEVL
jgi:hypothetical protein